MGLLDVKSGFKFHVRHQNDISKRKYISSAISSQQISGKNSESNKSALEKFQKNLSFGFDVKL